MADYVLCLIDDLFFASKIRAVAESLGVEVIFARDSPTLLRKAAERPPFKLILDLNVVPQDLTAFMSDIRHTAQLSGPAVIGFYSHVDNFLRERAIDAGIGQVLPRSAFTKRLGELISSTDAPGSQNPPKIVDEQ